MREEKVKGLLFLGEKAVFSHGGPFIVRPGNKRRSSGEPAKTGFSTRLGPPWAHLSLLKQQASCQKRLGYGFVSPLVSHIVSLEGASYAFPLPTVASLPASPSRTPSCDQEGHPPWNPRCFAPTNQQTRFSRETVSVLLRRIFAGSLPSLYE